MEQEKNQQQQQPKQRWQGIPWGEPLPHDAPAVGVAAGARHQARRGTLLAIPNHRSVSPPSLGSLWMDLDLGLILSTAGRLWIHAASKVPDPDTIKAMEDFYREIYAVDGITDINFPQHYPVSRLLG